MGILAIIAIVLGMLIPPTILISMGIRHHKTDRTRAIVLYILGVVWLVVGSGICASVMSA